MNHVPLRGAVAVESLPVPMGWYCVATSAELVAGTLRTVKLAGAECVAWRTASGRAVVSSAYCPHLGAHLGHGGRVEGEAVRCPFHGFCFDAGGACTSTGYGTRPPDDARLPTYPTVERHGFVLAWYHPEGGAPTFEIPDVDTTGWTAFRCRQWEFTGHPQETTENSVDIGHLTVTHGYSDVGVLAPLRTDGALLNARYFMHRPSGMFGRSGRMRTEFEIFAYGLGYSRVEVEVPSLELRTRQMVLCTPLGAGQVRLLIGFSVLHPRRAGRVNPMLALFGRRWAAELVALAGIRGFAHDVEQDFAIWQNKVHLQRPVLADGDGPIVRYRRWSRQFYVDG